MILTCWGNLRSRGGWPVESRYPGNKFVTIQPREGHFLLQWKYSLSLTWRTLASVTTAVSVWELWRWYVALIENGQRSKVKVLRIKVTSQYDQPQQSEKCCMLYAVFAFVLANYLYRHPKESTPISPGISWTKDRTVGKGKLGRLVQFLLWNKKWPVEYSPCVLFAPTLNVDCALFGMNMLPSLGLLQIKVIWTESKNYDSFNSLICQFQQIRNACSLIS